ncbi:hypothetical protein [Microbacterium sp. CIAB417]|uniref:hypothetical protein n=1 Tax=Microbacterium sp. CIAB417 TaxID=2860287 RepID=UPI0035AB9247
MSKKREKPFETASSDGWASGVRWELRRQLFAPAWFRLLPPDDGGVASCVDGVRDAVEIVVEQVRVGVECFRR